MGDFEYSFLPFIISKLQLIDDQNPAVTPKFNVFFFP